MADDILLIHTDERVRTLTLNRPQSRNALSAALRDQFFGALADAETDDDVDVIIVTGTDPVFCAGLDLKELGGQSALPDISPRWPALSKPVIGAINGAAVTGGLELDAVLRHLDRLGAGAIRRHPCPGGPAADLGAQCAASPESRHRTGPPDEPDR